MLYFQALQRGLAELPEADETLRAELDAAAAEAGWAALHARLAQLDPLTADRLQPNDAQRIQRALEVCLLTGEPMSSLLERTEPLLDIDYLNIGLLPGKREVLHERIAERLQQMLDQGFEEEVASLLQLTEINKESHAMRAVGYRQLAAFIAGEMDYEEACDKALVATRQLAKRQMTWLRSWPELQQLDCLAEDLVYQAKKMTENWLRVVQVSE